MLRNCDKIITAIQWPQKQMIVDDNKPSSSPNKPMEKPNQDPPPPPHPLKCPRCDSSNTKFCYYNNYSLSQPRHFCKACKRYWTRGGTLRNVPVGGGCRKNKRSKRTSAGDAVPSTVTATATVQRPIDLSSPPHSTRIHNPLFYNPVELNFPFSSFRVSSDNSGFDLHSQMNGFSSSGLDHHAAAASMGNDFKNGFKPIQGNHNSIFFGSSNLASTSTMASLLASTHKFDAMMPYEDPGNDVVKLEGGNRSVWNPNPIDQINSSDPSSLVWNNANLGAWFDHPSNMGSSVPSLI